MKITFWQRLKIAITIFCGKTKGRIGPITDCSEIAQNKGVILQKQISWDVYFCPKIWRV